MIKRNYIAKVNGISSDKIINLNGYTKPNQTSPIAPTDTLNIAIGKLEKALENAPNCSVDLSNGGTINGSLTVTGDILSNGNITAFSDIRLKENIKPIENSLEKINKLTGITYNLIGDNKKQAGLIAQDVQKVLPEVIVENKDGMLSVDYSRIVALLINAINELDKRIGV